MFNCIISNMGDKKSVSVIGDGLCLIADGENPNWDEIVDRVINEDFDGIEELFSLEVKASLAFEPLSERVVVRNGRVYFDNSEVNGPLANHLLRTLREGDNVEPLVKFWENLANNPSAASRENLFHWLQSHEFTIDNDGMVVAYKGVRADLSSVTSGPGFVNGFEQNGNLDNSPGNVLEVDRTYVDPDPQRECSRGLHVGTWDYASDFGHTVVEVRVNPRDAVAVPQDFNGSKMRVSRYKVSRVLEGQHDVALLPNTHEEAYAEWLDSQGIDLAD